MSRTKTPAAIIRTAVSRWIDAVTSSRFAFDTETIYAVLLGVEVGRRVLGGAR